MITSETYLKNEVSHDMWLFINEMKVKAMDLERRRVRKELNQDEENEFFTYKISLMEYDMDVEELVDLYSE